MMNQVKKKTNNHPLNVGHEKDRAVKEEALS
jgi:hypothetical protein